MELAYLACSTNNSTDKPQRDLSRATGVAVRFPARVFDLMWLACTTLRISGHNRKSLPVVAFFAGLA